MSHLNVVCTFANSRRILLLHDHHRTASLETRVWLNLHHQHIFLGESWQLPRTTHQNLSVLNYIASSSTEREKLQRYLVETRSQEVEASPLAVFLRSSALMADLPGRWLVPCACLAEVLGTGAGLVVRLLQDVDQLGCPGAAAGSLSGGNKSVFASDLYLLARNEEGSAI